VTDDDLDPETRAYALQVARGDRDYSRFPATGSETAWIWVGWVLGFPAAVVGWGAIQYVWTTQPVLSALLVGAAYLWLMWLWNRVNFRALVRAVERDLRRYGDAS
jgi:hypothetical protein